MRSKAEILKRLSKAKNFDELCKVAEDYTLEELTINDLDNVLTHSNYFRLNLKGEKK
jgi:hypothetical protein